ncbi:MAG TPA: hypothetical protein PL140_02010 [Ferrovaceae bacterium]|nr:hypothetical protein [Ferrovum sp. JA12]HQU06007.1 hypothetical protein [Ferrovaceae bacterium]
MLLFFVSPEAPVTAVTYQGGILPWQLLVNSACACRIPLFSTFDLWLN